MLGVLKLFFPTKKLTNKGMWFMREEASQMDFKKYSKTSKYYFVN